MIQRQRQKRTAELRSIPETTFNNITEWIKEKKKKPDTEDVKEPVTFLHTKSHFRAYNMILKHMFKYTRDNREEIVKSLTLLGFSMAKVERCFNKLAAYNAKKQSPEECTNLLKKTMKVRTTYTFILKETIRRMLSRLKAEERDTRFKKLCREICSEFMAKSNQLLSK